ncbi:MAG: SynChlorMet cassette radical SAM/SPASM protein ScmF [Candidatus Aminicenantes bacterium]|nr:SynChlorMet cassette radical SAM/SPASM protein ScmF [Candidatus Aminicenantes bacterium]
MSPDRPASGPENASGPAVRYPLSQLYFYLTEGCNLACRHCWLAPKLQQGDKIYPMLDVGLLPHILRQAKPLGLQGVKLTGGEPLMHPEILSILEHIRAEDLNCTMETNGVLCTPEIARELARQKGRFVSVSLDGADAETNEWVRGVPGCFDAAVRGIKNLVETGIRPQIILTVMKRNRSHIEPIVRLAEKLGAGSVKFNVLMPTARGEDLHKRGEALPVEELIELGRFVESDLSRRTSLSLIFHHPPVFRPLGRMFGRNGDGCTRCGIFSILGVLADGSYALCGIGETVPELVFGRADRDRLEDVWNNNAVLNDIRTGLPGKLKGVCGECLMKTLCLGSCVAQNYYSTHDLFSPFWFCEEARKKGLFPESRLAK